MTRYRPPPADRDEFQPGSRGRVLRNLLGLRSKGQMDEAEASALPDAQTRMLDLVAHETVFSSGLICQMHREWLGGIYE